MSWERGRADIERLLDDGELQRVTPSTEVAKRLVAHAEAHIGLASKGVDDDPAGALQLAYDAARKASMALLAVQGLRSSTKGGHIAVVDAVRSQFNDKGGVAAFGKINRLRRRRNETEYPDADSPGVTSDEAAKAIALAREVLDAAAGLLKRAKIEPFD